MDVNIKLTEAQHRELLTIIIHYSTRPDRWAISHDLKLALIESGK